MPAIPALPPLLFTQARFLPLLAAAALGALLLYLSGCGRRPRALWPQLAVRFGGRLVQRGEVPVRDVGWELSAAARLFWRLGADAGALEISTPHLGGTAMEAPNRGVAVEDLEETVVGPAPCACTRRRGGPLGVCCLGLWLASGGSGASQSTLNPPGPGHGVPTAGHGRTMPPPAGPDHTLPEWRWALRRYRREPTVAQVVVLARRHRHRAALSGLSELAERSRFRGAVPRLSLSMRHGQAYDYVDTQVNVGNRLRVGSDRDLAFQVELLFDLPALVASDEETALMRLRNAELRADATWVQELVKLYFERRRLQILRDIGLKTDVRTQIRILEIQALLDGFTGNAFSRMIQREGRRRRN